MNTLNSAPADNPQTIETLQLTCLERLPEVIGTFMGRDALSLAISYLALGADDTVLLPVYTCKEVIKTFATKTQILFYDVRPDLTIDPDEVRSKLKDNRIRMMLTTNYFGFLQPYRREIKKICADMEICLIEDCAHSLLTEGSGETGDLSVYSFRKILPLPDGGGLKVNHNGDRPAPKYYPNIYSNFISMFITVKKTLNIRAELLSRSSLTANTNKIMPSAAVNHKDERILPLSRFARHRMSEISLREVIQKRRSDFQFWQELSRANDSLEPVFRDLPSGVCPLGFVVKAKDRSSLESRARSAGIPLSVHWRLDPTVGTACKTSHELAAHLLTLPVYPDVGPKAREVLAGIIARR